MLTDDEIAAMRERCEAATGGLGGDLRRLITSLPPQTITSPQKQSYQAQSSTFLASQPTWHPACHSE